MNRSFVECDDRLSQAHAPSRVEDLRLLLLIAAPNVISTVAETLLSFVDYAIVSQLGLAAQAAVSSAGMVFFSVFGFVIGLMVCVTTVVSQSLGAGRYRDCSVYVWQALWLCLLFGVVGVLLWPVVPIVYELIGHEAHVRAMEIDYTRIRLLGLGVASGCVALGHYFIGIHKPHLNAISVVLANVLNVVLSYGLVLGKWGLPAMGVEGAAVGTVLANIFRLAGLWLLMYWGRTASLFEVRSTWRIDKDKMKRLLRVGCPAGLSFMADITAWAVLLVLIIGMFGTTHLAATATCWRYVELSFMPAVGIGIAVSATVGKAIGAGRLDLARRRAKLGVLINMTYMGLMAVMFVAFGGSMMRLFSDDAEVVRLGRQLLVFAAAFQLFDAVAITYTYALRGAGDTRWPATVGAALAWGIMVGGGWWVAMNYPALGAKGPWIFATVFVVLVGAAMWGRWLGGKWEEIDVIGRVSVDRGGSEPVVAGDDAAGDP